MEKNQLLNLQELVLEPGLSLSPNMFPAVPSHLRSPFSVPATYFLCVGVRKPLTLPYQLKRNQFQHIALKNSVQYTSVRS